MATLLIDGDILAYKAAAIVQDVFDFGDGEPIIEADMETAIDWIDDRLADFEAELEAEVVIVCLSDDQINWRKGILPSYKGQRSKTGRPELLYPLKDWMREKLITKEKPTLEADDVMGILSTHPKLIEGEKIIVSEDKDMLTIPGMLYNPDKKILLDITEDEADFYHFYQTIIGDTTDNYKGCPGLGHVAARNALLEDCSWETVVSLFESKGFTEADALVQAQVARICRSTEYNYRTKEVKPWTPNTHV